MAKGFDEMVNHLLDEVALRFQDGATLDDFKTSIINFYDETNTQAPAEDADTADELASAADRQLIEKAWSWLLCHPEVWVGAAEGETASPTILVDGAHDASVLSLTDAETIDAAAAEPGHVRLWTSHERVWMTIAGHGVDFKRVPGEEFRLLCLIAGAGSRGIAQPDLVRLSKQDKKSVPGRTDNLNRGGYIRKTRILAEKHNTSLLVHRRFLPEGAIAAQLKPVFVDHVLVFENLLAVLKIKLKDGREIKMEDLEEFVGCPVRSWEKRALWRALERLDIIGVIQRFRRIEKRMVDGKKRTFKTKFVRFLREPNDKDITEYTALTLDAREAFRRRLEAQDAEAQGEHAEYMDDDDYGPATAETLTEDDPANVPETINMAWEADVPWTTLLQKQIEKTGDSGLSSMRAREVTYGKFYDRPVEQMLARLSDVWQISQPDHLKHFSIIRDTDTRGRVTNYIYRTHDAYQQAVEKGSTLWENANGGQPYVAPVPKLDQFGFNIINEADVVDHGAASVGDCILAAQISSESLGKTEPMLDTSPSGELGVKWRLGYYKRKDPYNGVSASAPKAKKSVMQSAVPRQITPRKPGRPPNARNTSTPLVQRTLLPAPSSTRTLQPSPMTETGSPASAGASRRRVRPVSVSHPDAESMSLAPDLAHESSRLSLQNANDKEVESPKVPKRRGRPPKNRQLLSTPVLHDEEVPQVLQDLQAFAADHEAAADIEPSKDTSTPLRESKLRDKAIEHAYHEAWERQKTEPPPSSMPGAKVESEWNAGRGRPRLLLVDDSGAHGDAIIDIEASAKRRPIVVKQSRVEEILQGFMSDSPTLVTKKKTSRKFIITIASSKLSNFDWFRESERPNRGRRAVASSSRFTIPLRANGNAEAGASLNEAPVPTAVGLRHPDEVTVVLADIVDSPPQPEASGPDQEESQREDDELTGVPPDTDPAPSAELVSVTSVDATSKPASVQEQDVSIFDQLLSAANADQTPEPDLEQSFVEADPQQPPNDMTEGSVARDFAQSRAPTGRETPAPVQDSLLPSTPPSHSPRELASTQTDSQVKHLADRRSPVLGMDVPEDSIITPSKRKDWSQRESTYVRPPGQRDYRKKRGTMVGRGTAQYKRTLIIEQIIAKNNGIYPGDSEIVPAFQRVQKEEHKSDSISDRDTVMKAVKSLVDAGKYKRIHFYFKDRSGRETQRWVLLRPDIDPRSPPVRHVMRKIQELYPRNYVPAPYGDGDSERVEQRKNIDRFQYQPGKSIVKPSGTDIVIDIEARTKELENRRLAAEEAKRAEESKRLRAQLERNKKRAAAVAKKQRPLRALLQKTTKPNDDGSQMDVDEDDPDQVMPSVETDGQPAARTRTSRPRHRAIRPTIPATDEQLLPEAVRDDHNPFTNTIIGAQPVDDLLLPEEEQEILAELYKRSFLPFQGGPATDLGHVAAPTRTPRKPKEKKAPVLTFKNIDPTHYDEYYEVQDTTSLLLPLQRFHPNTGTFSTDFYIRANARLSFWRQPTNLTFEHHQADDPQDVQWLQEVEDNENFFHPDKHERQTVPRPQLVAKRSYQADREDESEDSNADPEEIEQRELAIMGEEFPGLLQKPATSGWQNNVYGHAHDRSVLPYKKRHPLDHITIYGSSVQAYSDIAFSEVGPQAGVLRPRGGKSARHADGYPDDVPGPTVKRQRRKTLLEGAEGMLPSPRTIRAPIRQSGDCWLSSQDHRRLFFACIAIRCLNGEFEGSIRWQYIETIFANHPNFDLQTFKARWVRMEHNYMQIVDRIQREFQVAFLRAYAAGRLPPLDVIHGSKLYYKDGADWNRLIDWALTAIPIFPDEVDLPVTREELDEEHAVNTVQDTLFHEQRERMENMNTTQNRRDELAHEMSFTLPLRKRAPTPSRADEEMTVARSWARANCSASAEDYDVAVANAKLQQLHHAVLMTATRDLHSERVLALANKARSQTNRNYTLSDQYSSIFNKRMLDAVHFAEAAAFKTRLDKLFAQPNPRLVLEYNTSDGCILALVEMFAAGRVNVKPLLPPVNNTIGDPWPRLTVWGFFEGFYKLRNMDKKTFLWDVEVTPTAKYIHGNPVETILDNTPPPKSVSPDDKRIPLWFDIYGNFLPHFWEGLVRSSLHQIATRAGITRDTLLYTFSGLVWDWELELVIKWLESVDVIDRSSSGALRAKEWWWLAVPVDAATEFGLQGDANAFTNGVDSGIDNGPSGDAAGSAKKKKAGKQARVVKKRRVGGRNAKSIAAAEADE